MWPNDEGRLPDGETPLVYAVVTASGPADQARLPEREEIHCQMKATITPPRIAKIQVLSSKKLLLTSMLKIAEAIQPPRLSLIHI